MRKWTGVMMRELKVSRERERENVIKIGLVSVAVVFGVGKIRVLPWTHG